MTTLRMGLVIASCKAASIRRDTLDFRMEMTRVGLFATRKKLGWSNSMEGKAREITKGRWRRQSMWLCAIDKLDSVEFNIYTRGDAWRFNSMVQFYILLSLNLL